MLDKLQESIGEAFTPEFQKELEETFDQKVNERVQETVDSKIKELTEEHEQEIKELTEQHEEQISKLEEDAEDYASQEVDTAAANLENKYKAEIKSMTKRFKNELSEHTESLIEQAEEYANVVADEKVNEKETELNEKFKNELNEKTENLITQAEEYAKLYADEKVNEKVKELKAKFKEELNEHTEQLIQQGEEYAKYVREEERKAINEHINKLNELAEEYVDMTCKEIIENLDMYAENVINEFINDYKDKLDMKVNESNTNVILDMFSTLCLKTGIGLKEINEAKAEKDNAKKEEDADLLERYNKEVNENIRLRKENNNLIKAGIINEMKDGLTILQAQKFEKIAETIDFTRDENFINKLKSIKENIQVVPAEIAKKPTVKDRIKDRERVVESDDDDYYLENDTIVSKRDGMRKIDVWNKFI